MKRTRVVVPWNHGLHARSATKLVQLARRYRSSILIKTREHVADAKSILSVLLLCAVVDTMLEVEISGDDELLATNAIEQLFNHQDVMDALPTDSVDSIGEDPDF